MSLYHQRGKKKNPDLSNRPVKPSQRSTSNPPSSASRASTVAPPIPSERTHDGFFTRILKTNPSSSSSPSFGGPKNRSETSHANHRAQSASRDVARASKSFPRRVKTTSSLVSRARRGNHPSDLSLAPHISTQKVHQSAYIYIRLTQKKSSLYKFDAPLLSYCAR